MLVVVQGGSRTRVIFILSYNRDIQLFGPSSSRTTHMLMKLGKQNRVKTLTQNADMGPSPS